MSKAESLSIALTDEINKFRISQSGDRASYAHSVENMGDPISHEQDRIEVVELRNSIIEGYRDALHGRTRQFSGDLMADLRAHKDKIDANA